MLLGFKTITLIKFTAMTDVDTYFNYEYLGETLTYGRVIVNLLAMFGSIMYIVPYYNGNGWIWNQNWNWATSQAWYWIAGGGYWWYWFIGCVWLFSSIKKPFPQKSMFWSIVVGQALAWLFTIYINVLMIVGGAMEGGSWQNLYVPIIYDVFFFGFNAIDYYLLFPKYTAFYRWREQEWWNPKWDKWLEAGGIKLDLDGDNVVDTLDDDIFNDM